MAAPKTLANFLKRKTQLYEQGADHRRIGQYVRNWWRWVRAGVVLGSEGMADVSIPTCITYYTRCLNVLLAHHSPKVEAGDTDQEFDHITCPS